MELTTLHESEEDAAGELDEQEEKQDETPRASSSGANSGTGCSTARDLSTACTHGSGVRACPNATVAHAHKVAYVTTVLSSESLSTSLANKAYLWQ